MNNVFNLFGDVSAQFLAVRRPVQIRVLSVTNRLLVVLPNAVSRQLLFSLG